MNDFLFPTLEASRRTDLERLIRTIDDVFPVPTRYRSQLPRDVAGLSRSLTAARSDRDGGYLGKPAELSAYLRYFLPWNVFRLARLLPALQLDLKDGDALTDLGSGPLTVPIALWLARSDLRDKHLEFRCLDRTGKVLEAGAKLFSELSAASSGTWKIRAIRGTLGTRIDGPKAALVTAANVLNELFWDDRHPVAEQAERKAVFLSALARDDGKILVVEPGIPRSGEFVSALRGAFIDIGRNPEAPCPHAAACPLPGGHRGAKWCHFAFETDEAPESLHKLSALAGIPKERATLSFLLAGGLSVSEKPRNAAEAASPIAVRVISDAFTVGDYRYGRYGCCESGLALVSSDKRGIDAVTSGALIRAPRPGVSAPRDEKSGALIFRIDARKDSAPPVTSKMSPAVPPKASDAATPKITRKSASKSSASTRTPPKPGQRPPRRQR
ncbi:MAG: small ribosomal subunit Rsm22 family protein [Treponemataceae bacterium]